jgi:hypothetical protein
MSGLDTFAWIVLIILVASVVAVFLRFRVVAGGADLGVDVPARRGTVSRIFQLGVNTP